MRAQLWGFTVIMLMNGAMKVTLLDMAHLFPMPLKYTIIIGYSGLLDGFVTFSVMMSQPPVLPTS